MQVEGREAVNRKCPLLKLRAEANSSVAATLASSLGCIQLSLTSATRKFTASLLLVTLDHASHVR